MSEELARLFHDTYERLAPSFGYTTREETRVFDPDSPNGRLMIAVAVEVEKAIAVWNRRPEPDVVRVTVAVRDEIIRQYRDNERATCPAGSSFYENEVLPYQIARAAIAAMGGGDD